ncbi:cytochrome P450 alkane hydroxylase [Aspergillus sclerotioniger CBS 115572]|uniref:Cytochrome P450 alkane hydroxylase n=1 Tax=Aspergillus sclerotioniger CBS 115572 TaxID=1450535 RepID=A0A317WZM7_9EURO|nr:cytochrome P450 alkane hydroxylase [Aspergillus sclerotioniger CBS 115572]PWY91819.1 cytochrome P450 alkane hydroxylase [Aspergillus sclerotioniger CBS 115572]
MLELLVAQMTPVKASVCLAGIFILACLLRKLQVSREISRLGARAPRVRFRLPYAIDHIYNSIVANRNCQDFTFWQAVIANAKGASTIHHPQTAELDAGISNRTIITTDPDNIRALLTGQFADFGKGEDFHRDWKEFLGDSIFVTDGELWSTSRHLIRPMFTRDRIVDTELFEKHIQHLIPLLAGTPDKKAVGITPLFLRYTLDAATDYLLGEGTNSLQNPATAFAEAFKYVQHRQGEIFRYGPFNFFLSRTQFRQNLQTMNNFIQPYIDRVLSLPPTNNNHPSNSNPKPNTFLDALSHFTRDSRVLRDQLISILLAGRDTTAITLSFCLYELSRNPTVVTHLRTEISTRLGLGPSCQKPTYTDLKEMKYLTAILNETTRLYPVVPFNVRYALTHTTLPTGGGATGSEPIGIRPNTRIVYSTMLMQRDPAHYPPPGSKGYFDPGKWIPERWMGEWTPKPWRFLPFNGGPRICLGQQFALVEMGYTLVRILQVYGSLRAEGEDGVEVGGDPRLRFEITLNPGCELNCVFEKDGGDGWGWGWG